MDKILFPEQYGYIKQFAPEPDDPLIRQMRNFAELHRIPVLYPESALFLEFLVKISQPGMLLELGTAIAYTAIRLAGILPQNARLVTVEKSKNNFRIAEDFIKRSGFQNIDLIFSDGEEYLMKTDSSFDFVFLDADKEDYISLLDLALKKLNKKGIIAVDNLLWHGFAADTEVPDSYRNSAAKIREFNDYFFSHPDVDSVLLPVGDGLGLGIRR